MKDISLQDCIDFQDCFLFDDKFQPFELVQDYKSYYPLALIGEFGSFINLMCKEYRSPNLYENEISDECADMFIYFLLFGRTLELHEKVNVFGLIEKHWETQPSHNSTANIYDLSRVFLEKLSFLLSENRNTCYTDRFFSDIFMSIKEFTLLSGHSWQKTINQFHQNQIRKYTDINSYTLDGLYKGSTRVDISKLVDFTDRIGFRLPSKRVVFLKKVESLRHTQ